MTFKVVFEQFALVLLVSCKMYLKHYLCKQFEEVFNFVAVQPYLTQIKYSQSKKTRPSFQFTTFLPNFSLVNNLLISPFVYYPNLRLITNYFILFRRFKNTFFVLQSDRTHII